MLGPKDEEDGEPEKLKGFVFLLRRGFLVVAVVTTNKSLGANWPLRFLCYK